MDKLKVIKKKDAEKILIAKKATVSLVIECDDMVTVTHAMHALELCCNLMRQKGHKDARVIVVPASTEIGRS